MIGQTYVERESPIHRLRPEPKLLFLPLLGTALFLSGSLPLVLLALALVLALYALARLPRASVTRQLRPVAAVLGVLFLAQALFAGWPAAALMALRLAALILAASLVTLTTRTSEMVETLERAFIPLQRFGLDPTKASLAISLAIRFVPVVAETAAEVREAQRARGLENSLLALAVPLIVRVLKMADEVAEAIDARSGR